MRKSLRERLLSRAVINWETGCWEWTGTKDYKGYGKFFAKGSSGRLAHRVTYELFVGPIPDGLQLDHLCRVRHCINPAHLEPVTPHENTMRSPIAIAALNAKKTHCPAGHEYTPENTRVRHGHRSCCACVRALGRAAYARRKAAARLVETGAMP